MAGRTIFITGPGSKIGRPLVQRLSGSDNFLRLLSRRPIPALEHDNMEAVQGDLENPRSYANSLEGVTDVIHLAAVTHTNDENKYFHVNAEGTRYLLEVCREKNVRRFIFISTRAISYKGGAYSRSKIRAEKYVRDLAGEWIILRVGEVYGIAGTNGIDMLWQKIASWPLVPVIGDGRYRLAPVHIDDVVHAIFASVDQQGISRRIYTIAGPDHLTFNELIDVMTDLKGLRKSKILIPLGLFRLAAELSVRLGRKGLVRDQIPRLLCPKPWDISDARRDLDFHPRSLREGLKGLAQ